MQRSVIRANNASQKASKTRNRNEALDIVQDRIEAGTQKEKMEKKTLKTAKKEPTAGKGENGNSKVMASKGK